MDTKMALSIQRQDTIPLPGAHSLEENKNKDIKSN